jgi:glycogen synthase
MKICHIAYQTWPTQCGAVMRLEQILQSQMKEHFNVFVVSGPFQEGESHDSIEFRDGVAYHRTTRGKWETGFTNGKNLLGRFKKFVRIFSFAKHVYSICKKEKPDIIHAHATFMSGLSGWITARCLGIPLVYEVRSTWEEEIKNEHFASIQRKFIKYLEKLTILLADAVVFISKGLKCHYVQNNKINASAIIYNCVKNPCKTKVEHLFQNTLTIGYIGSLVDYEGLEYLIEVSTILREKAYNFSVIIVGGGEREYALRRLCCELNLGNIVKFYGRVDSSTIQDYYDMIDLVVLPRKNLLITNKVAGLKPIEAFAHHKIVIAADVGGMKELFTDGEHGLFFRSEDILDLEAKITWVYNNRKQANRLAENGYKLFIDKFTLETMGQQYNELYKKCSERKCPC